MLNLNFVTQVHQIWTMRKLFCCIDFHDILVSYQNNLNSLFFLIKCWKKDFNGYFWIYDIASDIL